jgi:hypothetical protein
MFVASLPSTEGAVVAPAMSGIFTVPALWQLANQIGWHTQKQIPTVRANPCGQPANQFDEIIRNRG